ncbi:hypothetical protein AMJ52_03520 [candidate division TA06 bacterium DG_78]|uniref:Uncharacterized protein n=1 Tax=candidate division TA06 bacterium DG_78 TaxID=1703772 RepID=A0A0S7YFP8_UNCT6|nr:MAG: hypothetical protein AMJ52_03520 [candidate division TA06 bacterium DG_78]
MEKTYTKHVMRSALLIFWCFIATFQIQCAQEEEEIAPIHQGLYFNYRYTLYGPGVNQWLTLNVSFEKADEEHFWMRITPVDSTDRFQGFTHRRWENVLVDKYFKSKSGDYYDLDPPGQIWIPRHKRKKGARLKERKIFRIKTWDKWDVCVLSGGSVGATMEWYYDTTTGFLVGSHMSSMGAGVSCQLIETNVPGLLPLQE